MDYYIMLCLSVIMFLLSLGIFITSLTLPTDRDYRLTFKRRVMVCGFCMMAGTAYLVMLMVFTIISG